MSEQQWEYRVLNSAGLPFVPIWTSAAAAVEEAEVKADLYFGPITIERRPVGDWQPYDPEADR